MAPPANSPGVTDRLGRWSPALVLVAGVLARAALWVEWRAWPGSQVAVLDAAWNLSLGERIAGGDLAAGDSTWMVAPGLAYLFALARALGGAGTAPPSLLLLALDLAFAEICRRLGQRLGGPSVGLIAGLGAALSAPLAFQSLTLMGAGPAGVLLGLALLGGLAGGVRAAGLAGLALGLSCLFRPNHLLLLPLIAGAAALRWEDSGRPRLLTRPAAAAALGLILALCPSLLRNRIVGGEWVPISANAGANLYMAQEPGSWSVLSSPPPGPNNLDAMTRYFVSAASQQAGRPLRPGEADRWWMEQARGRISADPGGAARRTLARLYVGLSTWGVQDHYAWQAHRRDQPVLGALPDPGWLAPGLAILGALAAWRAGRRTEALLLGGVVLGIAASLAPFGVVERYRVPGWIALYPLAALGLADVARSGARRAGLAIVLCFALSLDPFKNRLLLPDLLAFGSTVPWSAMDEPREAAEASNIAAAFVRQGDLEEAERALRQALTLDPRRLDDRVALAGVLINRGALDAGLQELEAVLAAAPRHANAATTRCVALVNASRVPEALQACALAAKLSPDDPRLPSLRDQLAQELREAPGAPAPDGISP